MFMLDAIVRDDHVVRAALEEHLQLHLAAGARAAVVLLVAQPGGRSPPDAVLQTGGRCGNSQPEPYTAAGRIIIEEKTSKISTRILGAAVNGVSQSFYSLWGTMLHGGLTILLTTEGSFGNKAKIGW